MTDEIGTTAIERAVRSSEPGGLLDLGFFGGEPLLEAELIAGLIDFARMKCQPHGLRLKLQLTTNGTLCSGAAWKILAMPEMQIHISHDGLPEIHDRHRRGIDGRGTSSRVLETIDRLVENDVNCGVVMVVRPDSIDSLPDGIRYLRSRGVRHIEPSLDLWTSWKRADSTRLEQALYRIADVWREGLPENSIGWFDEKAAHIAGLPREVTARCGFGDGELAVTPSGNLYPCERLIGDDSPDNPMRLPGHVFDDICFQLMPAPGRSNDACGTCGISQQCNTTCRCANYVRTGDIRRPDGLLCLLDQVCFRETARILGNLPVIQDNACPQVATDFPKCVGKENQS